MLVLLSFTMLINMRGILYIFVGTAGLTTVHCYKCFCIINVNVP